MPKARRPRTSQKTLTLLLASAEVGDRSCACIGLFVTGSAIHRQFLAPDNKPEMQTFTQLWRGGFRKDAEGTVRVIQAGV